MGQNQVGIPGIVGGLGLIAFIVLWVLMVYIYHSDDWYTPNFDGLFGLVVVPALGVGIVLLYLTGERVPDHED